MKQSERKIDRMKSDQWDLQNKIDQINREIDQINRDIRC